MMIMMMKRITGLVHYRKAGCRGRWWWAGPRTAEEEEMEEVQGLMTPQPGEKASSQKPPAFSPETQRRRHSAKFALWYFCIAWPHFLIKHSLKIVISPLRNWINSLTLILLNELHSQSRQNMFFICHKNFMKLQSSSSLYHLHVKVLQHAMGDSRRRIYFSSHLQLLTVFQRKCTSN